MLCLLVVTCLSRLICSSSTRRIWTATKKDFPSFPTEVHSSHLRKLATALAHMYGDNKLRGTVHDALNHSQTTSQKSYKSTIRKHEVAEAKLQISTLFQKKSIELKTTLQPSERWKASQSSCSSDSQRVSKPLSANKAAAKKGKRVPKVPRLLETSYSSDSKGVSKPFPTTSAADKGKRVPKVPRFLEDFLC